MLCSKSTLFDEDFLRSEKISYLKCLSREDDRFVAILLCINKRRPGLQKNISVAYDSVSLIMYRSVFWVIIKVYGTQ